jgi:hypothetical protein
VKSKDMTDVNNSRLHGDTSTRESSLLVMTGRCLRGGGLTSLNVE